MGRRRARVPSASSRCGNQGGSIAPEPRYERASLGDLVELLVDGWRIDELRYSDSSGLVGAGPPAAFVELRRGPDRRGVFVPEDERSFSDRGLVRLCREHPGVWKHVSPERLERAVDSEDTPRDDWEPVVEPFPSALALGPETLRQVIAVGQRQSIDGVTIALLALERHEGGSRVGLIASAELAVGPDGPVERRMSVCDLSVVDDLGRRYRVAALPMSAEANRLEGALAIAPAIPEDVRRVTVTIGGVADAQPEMPLTDGPWVFPIDLTRP